MVKRRTTDKLNAIIYFLRALRVLLVLIPQNGYIHPDEYFQSVEVLVGRVFDVEHSAPWEFNTSMPIRGMTIPYFTTGLGLIFLRDIYKLALEYLSISVVSPYFLLIIPRLIMTAFTFLVDYSLQRICINNNEKYKTKLIVLGTSYVILVYGTRTFSNTIELVLFSILSYYVCESQTFSNELLQKREYIKYRYDKSTTVVEKAKLHKLRLYLVSDNYRNCVIVATITMFGIFNRPTFIGYAVMPIFFWIYRGTGHKRVSVTQFHTRILFFAVCCVPAFGFNVIIDSFYYGYITWGEVGMLDVSLNSFVVTPLNFIRYNINSSNLAKHGLHPRGLHFLVNIPLLFNVLGLLAYYFIGKYIYWILKRKFTLLPSIRSIKMLMTMSFVSPIVILSIFPHQEPRFLIPLLFPLIYLHSDKILPEPDNVLVKVPDSSIQETRHNVKVKTASKWFKIWLIVNSMLVIFYGFIHQGGVYYAVNYLHKDIKFTPLNTEFHIVTSHIYSLPESFILQKSSNKVFENNQVKYAVKKRVFLYEEGSTDLMYIMKYMKRMIEAKEMHRAGYKNYKHHKIYILVSSSRQEQAEHILRENDIIFKQLNSFWPHISTEAFPDFTGFCLDFTSMFYKNCRALSFSNYIRKIRELCSLTLFELNYKVAKTVLSNQV